jgi:putative copper export protein
MRFLSLLIHLLAAAVWIGGLGFQALVLIPGLRGTEAGAEPLVRLSRRFHLVTGIALLALVATGIGALATGGLPPLGRLLEKLFLVLLLVLATGLKDHWALPRLARAAGDERAAAERRFAAWTAITALLGLLVLFSGLRLARG